jgi:PhnB protein
LTGFTRPFFDRLPKFVLCNGQSTVSKSERMNTTITSYLTFQGNCREAMTFYQECLGGKLFFQTIGESPLGNKLPDDMKQYILNATLINGNLNIVASDMVPESGLLNGNSVSLLLCCSSAAEASEYFIKLSTDGHATDPLMSTCWGSLFGGLVDKFGNHWLLSCKDFKT